jgi:hypothetical protein
LKWILSPFGLASCSLFQPTKTKYTQVLSFS